MTKKYNENTLLKIDEFVGQLEGEYKRLKHFCQYLKLSEENEKIVKDGLKLLKRKIKAMKKCTSVEEIKEYLSVKKVLKEDDKKPISSF